MVAIIQADNVETENQLSVYASDIPVLVEIMETWRISGHSMTPEQFVSRFDGIECAAALRAISFTLFAIQSATAGD